MPIFSGESFIKTAISTWGNTVRAIVILAAFVLSVYLGATFMRLKGNDIKIEGKNVTIHLAGKDVTIVDVPAYQIAVPSGVRLEKNSKITFKATGLVTTGTMPDCCDLMEAKNLGEAKRSIIRILNSMTHHLDWRTPDGKFYYVNQNALDPGKPDCWPPKSMGEESDEKLIYPKEDTHKTKNNVDYGYLLAFIVPHNDDPQQVLAKSKEEYKTKILKVGLGTTLEYDEKVLKFISPSNPDIDIDSKYVGGEIYFTINDTIIRTREELGYKDKLPFSDECNEEIHDCYETIYDIGRITAEDDRHTCDKMSDPDHPYGIWYLDNRGSFTVTVVEEKI
jgi:hypothetical protein